MRFKFPVHLIFLFLFVVIFSSQQLFVFSKSGLNLEWEQHWEDTYGVGGTCNFGTHNFFVGDIDQDGVIELVTGGMKYENPNYTYSELLAPLKIWNWNGEVFTLEKEQYWAGIVRSIYSADLNADGVVELITAGSETSKTGVLPVLSVWNWDNVELVLKDSFYGIYVSSIFVADLDGVGNLEIVTAGTLRENSTRKAQLCVWSWDGFSLDLLEKSTWCAENNSAANSVYVYDLDDDGFMDIITGGYDNDLINSSGQLRIWSWDGIELGLRANREWRAVEGVYGTTITGDPMGNTLVNNLKVGDVDNDGVAEIVTGGFAFNGEKIMGQISIWNWWGETVSLEEQHEWVTEDITEIKAMYIADVNDDGQLDIISSGATAVFGGFSADAPPESAQLRIWNWNGQDLSLDYSEQWTIGEGVMAWNVAASDVDKDETVEIITVGCMYISALCDPDLRIWSIAAESSDSHLSVVLIGAIIVISVLLFISIILVIRRRKNNIG
jgi:hypothetical protein